MDITHKIAKVIDHYRYTALAALAFAVMLGAAMIPACSPIRAPSPISGESVTAAELQAEQTEQAKIRSATNTGLKIQAEEVRREAEAKLAVIALQSEGNAEAAALEAEAIAETFADMERRAAERETMIQTALGAVQAFIPPGYGEIFGAIAGIGGALLAGGTLADSKRKDRVISAKSEPKPAETTV